MQNRYFYYPVLVNMVANIMVFVPHILIEARYDGAFTSMMLSVVIGIVLLMAFAKSMEKFPKQSVPEVMGKYFPKWVVFPLILYFTSFWYVAGAIAMLLFASITKRYLMPETSLDLIIGAYCFTAVAFATLSPKRFLFGVEALFFINVPLTILILAKSVTANNADVRGVIDFFTHAGNWPQFTLIAAGTFVFSGYANMAIFGKTFRYQLKKRDYALFAFLGTVTLLTSVLIPIARLGEFAVDDYVFTWIAASDTVDMQYFVIERMMIPFLLIYLMISLVTCAIQWHVGYHLLDSQFHMKKVWSKLLVLVIFFIGGYLARRVGSDESKMFDFASMWLRVRFVSEVLFVLLIVYLARKEKRSACKNGDPS